MYLCVLVENEQIPMRLLCWSKLFTEVDVFRLAWQQCGTSWERADREPAAATSTWSSETPAITAKEQTPQRGIRDGLCLIYPLKSPPMIQRQFFFVHAKESSAFIWKMANDSPAKSLVDIDLASLRVSAAEPSLCFFSFLFFFFSCSASFYFTLLDKTHVPRSG